MGFIGSLALGAGGLASSWVRSQLTHAAHASQFLTVFTSSGAVFQTYGKFEHIPFLAHPLSACPVIDATLIVHWGRNTAGSHDLIPRISDSVRRLWLLPFETTETLGCIRGGKLACPKRIRPKVFKRIRIQVRIRPTHNRRQPSYASYES